MNNSSRQVFAQNGPQTNSTELANFKRKTHVGDILNMHSPWQTKNIGWCILPWQLFSSMGSVVNYNCGDFSRWRSIFQRQTYISSARTNISLWAWKTWITGWPIRTWGTIHAVSTTVTRWTDISIRALDTIQSGWTLCKGKKCVLFSMLFSKPTHAYIKHTPRHLHEQCTWSICRVSSQGKRKKNEQFCSALTHFSNAILWKSWIWKQQFPFLSLSANEK